MRKYLMRLASLMLIAALLPINTVYGQDDEQVCDGDNYVTFTYDEALRRALRDMLPIIDSNAQIRDIQDQRNDLRDDLRDLEQGRNTVSAALRDDFWAMESQIAIATHALEQMQQTSANALNDFLYGLSAPGEYGFDPMLAQILQTAIQSVVGIQDLSNSIAMMEMQRQSILAELNRTSPTSEMITETRRSMTELDRQIRNLSLQQEITRLIRENAFRSAIIAVTSLQESIGFEESILALQVTNLNRAYVRYEFGLVSSNYIREAESALVQAQMNIDGLRLNLNTAMGNLNHMLGEPLYQHTVIEFQRELFQLPEDKSIRTIITETPTIRQQQINVDRARDARNAYTGNDRDTIAVLRDAYQRAAMERDQAIDAMEISMLRVLNEFENLLFTEDSLLIELANAYQAMENTLLNFEFNRATQNDVEQAQLNIYRIRQRLESNSTSKWAMSFLLQNPSLL